MNTNKISLSAISPELKNKLLSGKALISTALVSAGALTLISAKNIDEMEKDIAPSNSTASEECIEFKSHALFGTADDNLNFGDAFRSQREALGPGGVFEYKNKFYNTYFREEWESLSSDQKKEYYTSIDKLIDYNTISHKTTDGLVKSVKIEVNIDPESGDISVSSLSPDVQIESVTINMGEGKFTNGTVDDPEATEVAPQPGSGFDDPFFDETNDIIIDNGQTAPFHHENVVDPTIIEIDDDNLDEPINSSEDDNIAESNSIEIEQEDNLTDPSSVEITHEDNLTDPSFAANTTEDDNLIDPSNQSVSNIPSLDVLPDSEITIDPADFNF